MRYVCFDVETPNRLNCRMSSIGICAVENNIITEEFYTLINPEQPFDIFNTELTGIFPAMVKSKPNFGQIWEKIEPLMKSGLLVAHNAQFDMSVLSKCLKSYDIPIWDLNYLCTCRMSQKVLPELKNHKLDTICDALGIELDHHNALSDAKACANILIHCLTQKNADPSGFIRAYDLNCARTVKNI